MQRLHQHNAGHMFQQFNWIQTSFQGNTHSDWVTLHQALHYFSISFVVSSPSWYVIQPKWEK